MYINFPFSFNLVAFFPGFCSLQSDAPFRTPGEAPGEVAKSSQCGRSHSTRVEGEKSGAQLPMGEIPGVLGSFGEGFFWRPKSGK